MRSPSFTRVVLLLLAASQSMTGLWAVLSPRGFYDRFPGFGSAWVAADGPFNTHLVVDTGAGFLATAVALLVAALWLRRTAVVVALAAYLAHAIPHTTYHLANPVHTLATADQVASTVPLVLATVVAAGVFVAWLRGGPSSRPRPAATPGRAAVGTIEGPPRGLLLRVAFAAARRRIGTVPTSWRVVARVPRLALARIHGDAAHVRTRIVPAALGSLATLRAATLVECAFCIDILSAAAWQDGVTLDQLRDLARWQDSPVYDADQRLVLALTDALTATPAVVDDTLRDRLVARFTEEGLIELATGIGHENARARVNRALGVPAQGFAVAAGCPLPERTSA